MAQFKNGVYKERFFFKKMDMLQHAILNDEENVIHFLLVEDPQLIKHVFQNGVSFQELFKRVFKREYIKK